MGRYPVFPPKIAANTTIFSPSSPEVRENQPPYGSDTTLVMYELIGTVPFLDGAQKNDLDFVIDELITKVVSEPISFSFAA